LGEELCRLLQRGQDAGLQARRYETSGTAG